MSLQNHVNIACKISKEGEWIPYQGPQGGEGWRNTETDEIEYQEQPPGEINTDVLDESQLEALEQAGLLDESDSEPDEASQADEIPMDEDDPRVPIESTEDAVEVLETFDEDDYEVDHWEIESSFDEGSIIEISVDEFDILGNGKRAVVTNPEENIAVTEQGETVEFAPLNSLETEAILGVWNDRKNEVATGQTEWSTYGDEYIPDAIEDEIGGGEGAGTDDVEEAETTTSNQSELETDFVDDGRIDENLEDSRIEDFEFEAGNEFIAHGELHEIESVEENQNGEVKNIETEDRFSSIGPDFHSVNGVLMGRSNGGHGTQYIVPPDESDIPAGFYQMSDVKQLDDDTFGYLLYSESEGMIQLEESVAQDSDMYAPVSEKLQEEPARKVPEPSGSKDVSEWSVDWQDATYDNDFTKSKPRLSELQKELFKREWKAAVDDEAYESVEHTIRSVKNSSFDTDGQFYDRLAKAVTGIDGEVRSNSFRDAEEPTEAEIEAMRVFREGSQKFYREQLGYNTKLSRGLAGFSHERIFEGLDGAYDIDDENGADVSVSYQDNPASIWSSEETSANMFATAMGNENKMLRLDEVMQPDDVLGMPDSVISFTAENREFSSSSDWTEGQVDVVGGERELQLDDMKIVTRYGISADLTLEDILYHTDALDELDDTEYEEVLREADKMLDEFAPESVHAQFKTLVSENTEDDSDNLLTTSRKRTIYSFVEKDEADIVIDVRNTVPPLHQVREIEGENTEQKVACKISKEGEWVPYQGPQGGEGWRSTETGEIEYQEQPPGALDADVLSDEQIEYLEGQVDSTTAEDTADTDSVEISSTGDWRPYLGDNGELKWITFETDPPTTETGKTPSGAVTQDSIDNFFETLMETEREDTDLVTPKEVVEQYDISPTFALPFEISQREELGIDVDTPIEDELSEGDTIEVEDGKEAEVVEVDSDDRTVVADVEETEMVEIERNGVPVIGEKEVTNRKEYEFSDIENLVGEDITPEVNEIKEELGYDPNQEIGTGARPQKISDISEAYDGLGDVESEDIIEILKSLSDNSAEALATVGEELLENGSFIDEDAANPIMAMAYHKGANLEIDDFVDLDSTVGTEFEPRLEEGLNESLDDIADSFGNAHEFGFLIGGLAKVRQQGVGGGGTGGYIAQGDTGIIKRKDEKMDPSVDTVKRNEDLFGHEFGHHTHSQLFGIEFDLAASNYYERQKVGKRSNANFGVVDTVSERGESFLNDMQEAYERYANGESGEIRQYQRRCGNEYMAISFKEWIQSTAGDSDVIKQKDPLVNLAWDKGVGGGEEISSDEVPELESGDSVVINDTDGLDFDSIDILERGVTDYEFTPENISDDNLREFIEDDTMLSVITLPGAEALFATEIPDGDGYRIDIRRTEMGSVSSVDKLEGIDMQSIKEMIQVEGADGFGGKVDKQDIFHIDVDENRPIHADVVENNNGTLKLEVHTDQKSFSAEISDMDVFTDESFETGVSFNE